MKMLSLIESNLIDCVCRYECNCSDTGFKGPSCEINIDDCVSSPCQHGGTCEDQIKVSNLLQQ